jgi:iron complex outermembrane receptor protein
VLAGLRYDEQTNDGQFNGVGQAISGSQVSPRIGATYFLTDDTILFGNWGKSFAPNFAFDIDGDVFESDQVRQIEVGLRQKLFDDRAQLTVAAFDIKRFNVVIPDINNFGQAVASGRQTSRGIEVDLTGELLPNLDAIFTYAYNETRVAEPTDPSFGQQLAAAPEHNASAFLRYEFADGPAAGLGFNAGLVFNSAIQASLPNTIVIPSNARLDIGASYAIRDDWRLAVNVNNVTNSRLYVTNLFALFPQAPRQVFVTLSRSFGD